MTQYQTITKWFDDAGIEYQTEERESDLRVKYRFLGFDHFLQFNSDGNLTGIGIGFIWN